MYTKYYRLLPVIALLFMAGCAGEQEEQSEDPDKLIDLTYAFNESTVYWPTAEEFELNKGSEGITDRGYFYSAHSFSMAEHGGTHIDAPYHFWEEGNTVDEIPVDRFIGPGIVVDVSDSALVDPDYLITRQDFKEWEQQHRAIPDGGIVLLKTGYGLFWPDREKYMGTTARGDEAVSELHFPGLHPEAAEWIATERDIKLIGIDTPSIDYGQSSLFESHTTLFKYDIPVLENVANLDKLPPGGFTIIALPIKIENGTGGPVRIIARL